MVESKAPVMEATSPVVDETANWADIMEQQDESVNNKVTSVSKLIGKIETATNKDGDRVETEYRQNPDSGEVEKVVTVYRQEKKMVLKSVAARKRLEKFGASKNDGPGVNKATTKISGEEIHMKFIAMKEAAQAGEDDELKKLQIGDRTITCRHCQSLTHLTAQCPIKNEMEVYKSINKDIAGGKPASLEPSIGGSYVPPGLRKAGGTIGGAGPLTRSNDQNCIRISNLPESITEEDLKKMCATYGKWERVFLSKDRITKISKGFGFVTYQDRFSAEKAINGLNRLKVDHLILSVEWAQQTNKG